MADGLINEESDVGLPIPTEPITPPVTPQGTVPVVQPEIAATMPTPVTPAPALDTSVGEYEAATYDADQRDINPETDTVQGQLAGLLSSDSPYLERAGQRGLATANKRGLLNSSMAVGAAEAAAIDAALPIAQQDADVYLRQGLENQAAVNTAGSTNAQLQSEAARVAASNRASMETQRFSEVEATRRQELILATDIATSNSRIAAEQFMANERVNQADRQSFTVAYNEMSRQNDVEIGKIAVDPDLSEEAKNRLIAAQNDSYSANVMLLGDLFGLDLNLDNLDRPEDYFVIPEEVVDDRVWNDGAPDGGGGGGGEGEGGGDGPGDGGDNGPGDGPGGPGAAGDQGGYA